MSPLVGFGPDLGQTDGRVKPVEDDERYTQMANNAPRQVPVELRVYWQMLGFFHFQDAHDPQREIEQQEQSDKCSSRLDVCLCRRADAAMISVDDEQCLQYCLFTHTHTHTWTYTLRPNGLMVGVMWVVQKVKPLCLIADILLPSHDWGQF